MATTTITVASLQTACAECADDIAAADWAGASSWYARAEAINAGLEVEGSHGDTRFRRREALAGLRQAIDAARASAAQYGTGGRFITTQTRFNG